MSTAPLEHRIRATHGYHPLTTDLPEILASGDFTRLLVFGSAVADVGREGLEIRLESDPPVVLPQGVFWFSGEPSALLAVSSGSPPGQSVDVDGDEVEEGSALDNALAWLEAEWERAREVPRPLFAEGEQVLVPSEGREGIVRPGRRFSAGRWTYRVFAGDRVSTYEQPALAPLPTASGPTAWVASPPVPPDRFAATLTRAKLDGNFTDTVFSFRATRTLFRPYQFKPVQKLLNTGTLRLLIADEVGLGKTIEAGLVWTEMEARRQADRVLVLCPSSLVGKWKREMEDRFGFQLTDLDNAALGDLLDRLETDRVPRRTAYVCSIERFRVWEGIERATELGLQFDLSIVDEAHAFRNSDTKSYELGEHVQEWSDALVMLSATPVNLRNRDLFNLLSLLVPGEFEDLDSLEARLAPNVILHRLTKSLSDPQVSNSTRRGWLADLRHDPFGRILTTRPDFGVLQDHLRADEPTARDIVAIKRVCAELHGLSAQITRTRKIDVQEKKPIRDLRQLEVSLDADEEAFYGAYLEWCKERADASDTPLNFSMQMPLRLAGSCLPEAARYVLEWTPRTDLAVEESESEPVSRAPAEDIAPGAALVAKARSLSGDTKIDRLMPALEDLACQGRRAILFTFSRRTLRYLEEKLTGRFRIASLHGSVPTHQRERTMREFREGSYDVVLATKVASEGLDFEFCSAVVNYDLPWNPMEVEQRIGRIDRIGQEESKISVVNLHTPGTIETEIIERVMHRLEVFEHSIGELEPILEAEWPVLESLLLDFSLSPEQRRQQGDQAVQAIEMQAKDREAVESAAPMLISSDDAEIDGLERDLLSTGRYVGQAELAVLLRDWAQTFGGDVICPAGVLQLRGTPEMSDHLQSLVRAGIRTASEVERYVAHMRSEQAITVSLDQEHSRTSEVPLLTAAHPLALAAARTPGHRHGRYTALHMTPEEAGVAAGTYLTLFAAVRWNGIRPSHEVWTTTVDVQNLSDAGHELGSALMKGLATASYRAAVRRHHHNLIEAVDRAMTALEVRVATRKDELERENTAFLSTRRASFEEVHQRRALSLAKALETNRIRGRAAGLRLTEARIEKEKQRFAAQTASLDAAVRPSLIPDELAVCVVEVHS